ncbi:hypothetical protein MTO96_003777 [Rhipicephalus appendiculatus]
MAASPREIEANCRASRTLWGARKDATIGASGLGTAVSRPASYSCLRGNVDSQAPHRRQQYEPAGKAPLLVTMFLFKCIISAAIGYFGTLIAPWLLDNLGFGQTGVRPKTVAAWWQARHKGSIPKNGFFAILQRQRLHQQHGVGCLRGGYDRRRCACDHRVYPASQSCLRSNVDSQGTPQAPAIPTRCESALTDFFLINMFVIRCIFAVSVGFLSTGLLPWLIRTLGFGPTGVKPNTVASRLQGQYKGVVPKNGYFGVLQKWGVSGRDPFSSWARAPRERAQKTATPSAAASCGVPRRVLAIAGSSHSCCRSNVDSQGTPQAPTIRVH